MNTFKVRGLPEGSYFRFKITAIVGGNEGARSEPYKVVTNPRKVQTKLAPVQAINTNGQQVKTLRKTI